MNHIWETHFGYVAATGKGCLVVGEWGGWYTGSDAVWQRAFSAYLSRHRVGSFYWALNPTSRDTGGLVLADWRTPNAHKLAMLSTMPGTALGGAKGGAADTEKHHPHGADGKHAAAAGEKHAEKHEPGSTSSSLSLANPQQQHAAHPHGGGNNSSGTAAVTRAAAPDSHGAPHLPVSNVSQH